MKDLTQGPIPQQLRALALPIGAGMLLQTLFFFVDLYFVSRLGDAAIAGVGAAGNLSFATFALNQMLAVGTAAAVSHAVGGKDQAEANHVFNQAVGIAAILTVATLAGGYALIGAYADFFAPDAATRENAATFLRWLMPSLVLQYTIAVMGAGLRGTGIVKPTTVVQAVIVLLNIVLAPILVAGWITGKPLGVAGAGLATTIATAVGLVVLLLYFVRLEHYVGFDPAHWAPKWTSIKRIVNIGLPAGGEFALMFITSGMMYWAARDFGTATQAGVALGFRINQMFFVPVVAVAIAAMPLAGQNFGARKGERVRETLRSALRLGAALMGAVTVVVLVFAEELARIFTAEQAVIASTVLFMHFLAWNYVPSAMAFICSSLFQAVGNTWPALATTSVRVGLFALAGLAMVGRPWFEMRYLYMASVATVMLQSVLAYAWLQREFARKLG